MASLRDLDRYLLDGIVLPRKNIRGRWPAALREEWHEVIELLLGRGVQGPTRMSRITGLTPETCKKLVGEVQSRWAEGVTARDLNWRREALYREAEEVNRAAWDAVTTARAEGNLKDQAQMLKVVLAGNQRKAKLLGADTTAIYIRQEISATIGIDIVAQVEADFGLAVGALEKLGKQASVLFSEASKKRIEAEQAEAIDVSFAVDGEELARSPAQGEETAPAPALPRGPDVKAGEGVGSALARLLAAAGED